jgi:ribosomal-protein-alanine N-acetyltransferase
VAAALARWLTGPVTACPTLVTERLTLRPFRADDLDPLLAIMTSPEVRASLHVPDDYGRVHAWGSLVALAGLWSMKGLGQWALEERETGRFVGRAGLYWRPEPQWPGVEVGWALDPGAWGLGYATEAGARAVRFGFEELGEDALYSVILPGNSRSEAVARRLGLLPGEERVLPHFPSVAHRIWRLERSAWEAATPGVTAG